MRKILPLGSASAALTLVGLSLSALFTPALRAQSAAYVFTKLVDSNDPLPGSDGLFFQPNERPAFDGSVAAFWNGPNLNFNSIWSVVPGNAPLRLVDRNTDAPGGTGKFTSFLIDFSAPGYLVLRQGTLIFAGRDAETTPGLYSAGIWSVPAAGGAVTRVANRNTAVNGGFTAGLQNFSFDAGRIAFHGVTNPAGGQVEGVYTADPSGGDLAVLADSDHPASSPPFVTNLFNLPSISAGNVAFYGQTVFDPSTGFNAFYTTPAAGSGFSYGQPMNSRTALPGNANVNFQTRLGLPRLDGDLLYFSADDPNTNPNYFGLYRVARTGGTVTRIADRDTLLAGVAPILSFQNYAASSSQLAFTARSTTDQFGLYLGDGSTITKVVASGDAGPFGDTLGTVSGVEIGAYSFVGGQLVARLFSPFSAYGAYLITPVAQSSDVSASVSASPSAPAVGASTTLTLTVTNAGPAAATTPVARLALPPGLTFQSASSGGALDGTGAIVFNLATIPAGGSVSVTALVRVDLSGTLTASAYVNAGGADSNRRNNHAWVSLPAPGTRTSNYLIRKIVDTETAIPDRPGQTFGIFGGNDVLPALDGGRVVFIAGETNAAAVWTANADGTGGFTRLVTTGTEAIPGYPGETFNGFSQLRLRNGTVAFYGGSALRHNGFYAAPAAAAGGAFSLIVNTSSTRPDRLEPLDFVNSFVPGLLADGRLTFSAQESIYAWPVAGGAGTAAVPAGTGFPVGGRASGQFFAAGISGTRVAFFSGRNDVHSAFLDERRYETNAAARLTVSPSDPAGGAFSDRFGGVDDVQVEGATVVFRAISGANDSIRGLYSVTGTGAPVKLVDTNTAVPGGTGNFSDLLPGGIATSYSLNGGEVAFVGLDANQVYGLYSVPAIGGTIQKIVAVGDVLVGGRIVQSFTQPPMQRNALGQRQIVFRADYRDPATNTGGVGYYVAAPASRLINLSTRARVEGGENVMIGGFVITGGTKNVIVRALGPSLAAFGVTGTLANPTLELFNAQGQSLGVNDNWRASESAVQATGFAPTNDLESAIVMNLPTGAYTAIVRGVDGAQGVAIVEAYDVTPSAPSGGSARLINVSTRARVQAGENVVIGGLVIGAGPSRRVVVRAIGPSLTAFGVAGALANPRVELYNAAGTLLFTNDDWQTQSAGAGTPTEISALGLAPTNAAEAALLLNLAPGAYTAIVRGQDGGSGVALVEAYEIP